MADSGTTTTRRGDRETEDILSEGSDIFDTSSDHSRDEDDFDDHFNDPEYVPPSQPLDRAQWMRDMFSDSSDSDSDDDAAGGFRGFHDGWTSTDFNPTEKRDFIYTPGVKVGLAEDASPGEAFQHIFTDRLWTHLITETNRFQKQTRPPSQPESRMGKWKDVTLPEMRTFIGLCIAMGILKLPFRREYWRQKKFLFKTSFPELMSRDKFTAIWRYLHLQDNQAADVDRTDKLWKLRWFLDYLASRFQALYQVNGFVSVDESMVKFKGRLAFRQYMPLKPTKWGVKVWVMAESHTGYCANFQVYTGREEKGLQEKGLAHRVVMDLAKPYYGSQLAIFMDNFYTGVELLTDMKQHGLYGCGTVRANRKGLPKNHQLTKKASLVKHDYRVAQHNDLTFCVWQDTKTVMVLSNYHNPTATGIVNRRKGATRQTEVVVPACLADYQKYMKGVDLMDQMSGYYQFDHRSKKWWRRVFFFFLSVSCHNAFLAARSVGGRNFKKKYPGYKDWLEDLAQELVEPVKLRSPPQTRRATASRRSTAAPSPSSSTAPSPSVSVAASPSASAAPSPSAASSGDRSEHDLVKLGKQGNRTSCVVCLEKNSGTGKRSPRTVYGCKQCDVRVCKECFGEHTRSFD